METVVIDNGTFSIKAGLAGTDQPHIIIPSVVGTAKNQSDMVGILNKAHFIGNEALAKEKLLNLYNPITNGVITNWDYITYIWQELFLNQFPMSLEDKTILVTEKAGTPASAIKTTGEIFFEKFQAKGFFSCQQSVLALFSAGLLTGIVLDCGESRSSVVPVYEGFTNRHAKMDSPLCGSYLTEYMKEMVIARDSHTEGFPIDVFRALKEKNAYVPIDFQAEDQTHDSNETINLINGYSYKLGKEKYQCSEVFFDPSIRKEQFDGIHQILFDSIMKCDIDIRKELYKNILVCGGTSMLHGYAERIEKEVIALAPPSMKIRVIAPPQRKNAVWTGGSILGSRDFFFQTMVVTKEEFLECGENIIRQKCHT